jgi:signal transduction histidine kinase
VIYPPDNPTRVNEAKLDKTLELTTSILAMRDLDTLLKKIADGITDDFGFEQCDVFLLNEETNAFSLRVTKGYPVELKDKVEGYAKSMDNFRAELADAQRLGRFTYLFKAEPETNGSGYYGLLHPERAKLPREHEDDWHELDVLYVTFEDSDGNIIGFLEPDGPQSRKLPSGAMVTNLEIFASLASIAVTNAKLLTTLGKTVKQYKTMLDTTAVLQEPGDLKTTLKRIGDNLSEFVPNDELSVYLVDWSKGLLLPVYATGPYVDDVMADVGPLSGLAGEVAKSGKVEIVQDSILDSRVEDIPGIEDLEVAQTMMAVPLKGKRGVEGVLELYRDKSRQFTVIETNIVGPFAAHAAIAIENAKLREELAEQFETLQKAYDEMKDLDKMKDSLVDTISHEMRTPLTTVMGYLEMASVGMYGEVPPKMKGKFETMLESVKRINQLVSAMLELSRLEKKTLKLDFEPVNIAMVTREVLKDLDRDIREKKHAVTVLFGNDLPVVDADRLRIHDIIENMVSNAVKYTNPGGQITVGADILGGRMHLWVKDTGVGIAPEDQDKIFDRFFLADAGLTRADGRLGVGLHICREIVRRHGGDMWFESSKGVGSTFHFAIPLKRVA